MFLQLRPQPLGAVTNTARDGAFPVINSGRELGRYFENETPGLQFRLALNYMMREMTWSPPRQAWVWAALDTAIYSALAAAWYFKWRGGPGVERRPRPWECYNQLDVLFDRVPNSTNSGDAERRSYPPGVKPQPSKPGELRVPESDVPDILVMPPSQPTPGTPRHPAYPSGHSTYSAAAARLLIEFFPMYREQLCRLADNTGLARLWAGVHWRSDHTFGQRVGTSVAELIIDQLRATGIPRFPAPRPGDEKPPNPVLNPCKGGPKWDAPVVPQLPPCQERRSPVRNAKSPGKAAQSRRGTSRR
jgi:membrane-associated phospholipid phosphatase